MGGAFTISELVGLGRQPHTGFLGRLSKHDKDVVNQCLEAVGISHKAQQHVASLSDGERQKAMIATAFLDVASRIETMQLLHKLAHEQNKAVLLSSHDISQSLLLADELWVITNDREVVTGTTEQVVMSGAMDRVFGDTSIFFNGNRCDYEAQLPTRVKVKLVCDDSNLARCMTNALLRNGIAIDETSPFALNVAAADQITLPDGKIVGSVKDVVKYFQ